MGFDDVAARMKSRKGTTRSDRLHELWHGEPPPVLPPVEKVAPAERTGTTVAAYAVLLLGLAIAVAAGIGLLLWFDSFSRWEMRGMYLVIAIGVAIGVAIVVKATMMFDSVEDVAPLPRADLRN